MITPDGTAVHGRSQIAAILSQLVARADRDRGRAARPAPRRRRRPGDRAADAALRRPRGRPHRAVLRPDPGPAAGSRGSGRSRSSRPGPRTSRPWHERGRPGDRGGAGPRPAGRAARRRRGRRGRAARRDPGADRSVAGDAQRLPPAAPRGGPRRSGGGRAAPARRRAAAAARRADPIKDDVDLAGEPTAFGCPGSFAPKRRRLGGGREAEGRRRGDRRQDERAGDRPLAVHRGPGLRRHPQPLEPRAQPGRLLGGAAAAVAAGLVSAAVGSDGAGSVRIPAAWTHLVGVKPQRGRISTWPDAEAFNGLTVIGPLARTVGDAALLLDVLSGNVPGDLHRPPAPPESFVASAAGRRARCASPSPSTSPSAARPLSSTRRSRPRSSAPPACSRASATRSSRPTSPTALMPGLSIMPRSMSGDPRVGLALPGPLAARPAGPRERPARPAAGPAAAGGPARRGDRPPHRRPDLPPLRRRPLPHLRRSRRCRSGPARGSATGRPTSGSSPPAPTPGPGTCSAGPASTSRRASPRRACRSGRSCSGRPTASRACSPSPPSSSRSSAGTSGGRRDRLARLNPEPTPVLAELAAGRRCRYCARVADSGNESERRAERRQDPARRAGGGRGRADRDRGRGPARQRKPERRRGRARMGCRKKPIPDSEAAAVPGGDGQTMQLTEASLRATGVNVSGYSLFAAARAEDRRRRRRSAAPASVRERAPGGAEVGQTPELARLLSALERSEPDRTADARIRRPGRIQLPRDRRSPKSSSKTCPDQAANEPGIKLEWPTYHDRRRALALVPAPRPARRRRWAALRRPSGGRRRSRLSRSPAR